MQLLDDLRNYIVYLYGHIEQLEKDKQYLLQKSLTLKKEMSTPFQKRGQMVDTKHI